MHIKVLLDFYLHSFTSSLGLRLTEIRKKHTILHSDENRKTANFEKSGDILMSKKYRPLGSRVLIELLEAPVSKGGILLPETAREKPKTGKVVAIGPGKIDDNGKTEPMSVKPGDEILYSSYSGTEVKDDAEDRKYLILDESDILGILN